MSFGIRIFSSRRSNVSYFKLPRVRNSILYIRLWTLDIALSTLRILRRAGERRFEGEGKGTVGKMPRPMVLMVAEKPLLAQSIAKILSNGSANSRKGFNGACSIHEWDGPFLNLGVCHFKMTSTCGHVMSLDFISRFNNWDRVEPVELFSGTTEKKEANPKLKMVAFLSSEGKNCKYLVLWLDCDKEGENICFEVIDAVCPVMIPARDQREQTIFRAHFSAITDRDLKAAFQKLGQPNELESLSVDARQELDLRVGCAFTRFQTRFFQGKYGNLDSSLISFGPCQTPTLGFCVDRHDEIVSFKPEPFWFIDAKVEKSNEKGTSSQVLSLEWARGRIFDKSVATLLLARIKGCKMAKVRDVTEKEGVKARPIALNTVELMRVASAKLGIGPQQAMHIAEQLYTQGFISYPRTETTSYPANFDLVGTLKQQFQSPYWGETAREILSEGMSKPRKGTDVGDHPPITPMRADSGGSLSGDHARIYEYIVRHFMGSISQDCIFLSVTARFDIGNETFALTGKSLLSPGFTKAMPFQALKETESVPDLKIGEQLPITSLNLVERETSPPDYLTEAELITLMEKHGIGTDASIPTHIQNIQQRNYVSVGSGRRLIPSNLGIVLVHGYWKIDPELVLPTMRAEVEEQLSLIAKGQAQYESVKRHALNIFKLKFLHFHETIPRMDELFEASFTSLSESGKPFSRCGKCRRYMKLIATKPQRLHCTNCQETYNLPQGRDINFRVFGEQKCPLDDFELVYWTLGAKGKSSPVCPYCYSNPPFPDMKKGFASCNQCSHPACPHSFTANTLAPCTQCAFNGFLVFDPGSGPKWKVMCNKCPSFIRCFEGAPKVKIVEPRHGECEDCNSKLVHVEYKEPYNDRGGGGGRRGRGRGGRRGRGRGRSRGSARR